MKSDTIAKIIVLLITLVLWLHLTLTKQQSTDIDLPVVLQDLPADLVYDNSEPLTIPVTLKGSGFDLMITMLSDHFFLVPAGHMTYGRNKITVNQGDLIVPEIVSLDIAYGEEGNEKPFFWIVLSPKNVVWNWNMPQPKTKNILLRTVWMSAIIP